MRFWIPALAVALAPAACGTSDPIATDTDAILGGFDAKPAVYDSVGALVRFNPDGTTHLFCTATLVSPTLVVSAKHCFVGQKPGARFAFAIGWNANAPRRLVPITNASWVHGGVHGMFSLGADVSVAALAEPVTDVASFEIGPVVDEDVGASFLAIGYGFHSTDLRADGPLPNGERKGAVLDLAARKGRYWELDYPTADAYVEACREAHPNDAAQPTFEHDTRDIWERTRLNENYDLVFGVPGQAELTPGDSGGPILRTDGSRFVVVGVLTGQIVGPRPSSRTNYSGFGPLTRHLVEAGRTCGSVSIEGGCSDEIATRCTRIDEGDPRVVRSNCGAIGHKCHATPKEPVCAPACTSDSDCLTLAPRGQCDVATGTCRWARSCVDEPEYLACTMCCGGLQTLDSPEYNACVDQCADAVGAPH